MQYFEASVTVNGSQIGGKVKNTNAIFQSKCKCVGCNDTSGVVTILEHFTNW